MAKFRDLKGVVVEAMQVPWPGDVGLAIFDAWKRQISGGNDRLSWFDGQGFVATTVQGVHFTAGPGDWIIAEQDCAGLFRSCSPKIFSKMFHALEAEAGDRSEQQTEAELQTKGKTAPRLTPMLIDAQIVAEDYHVFPGTTLTVAALTLQNGFIVTGQSRPASDDNFDDALGRRLARENARNKIWELEGYALRNRLAAAQP